MSFPHSNEPMGDGSWISWFLGVKGNGFLCRVPTDFIEDKFNLTGLEFFGRTMDLVLDPEFDNQGWDDGLDSADAEQLYGMIHARYIVSPRGVEDMRLKYERGDFGSCPRVYCKGQRTLPVGLSDLWNQSHVKVYCPRCNDVFLPRSRSALLDGAMFGTSFPHMFFMQLPSMRPHPPLEKYVPRLYGFRLHQKALMPPETPESTPKSIASLPSKSPYLTATIPKSLASRFSRNDLNA